jgi:hypothetical protein
MPLTMDFPLHVPFANQTAAVVVDPETAAATEGFALVLSLHHRPAASAAVPVGMAGDMTLGGHLGHFRPFLG